MFITLMHFKKIFDKENLNFIFGGGAGKMPFIGTILQGWGCKVLYLFDNDQGKQDGEKNLKNNWYTLKNFILSITDNKGEAIEDIFSKNNFKKYVLKNENQQYDQSILIGFEFLSIHDMKVVSNKS